MWLSVGPVDDLANPVADLIISDPDLNTAWIAKWRARPNEALRQPAVTLQGRDDLVGRLGEITCPALVVHGVDDVAIDMADAEKLAAGLPGSSGVVKVPGAHAANLTHPQPVNDAIVQFLSGLPD
jgi:3-oxoadipate enol-lactonase